MRWFRGVAASPGVALGPAVLLPRAGDVEQRRVEAPEREAARFRASVEASRRDIEAAKNALGAADGLGDAALILEAQELMHSDALLVAATVDKIIADEVNAEWALAQTIAELQGPLLASPQAYFRERADDIAHVGRHILRHLRPSAQTLPARTEPCVLIADELTPADAIRLLGDTASPILAVVTERGSYTSHTALLARTLDVPAVLGAVGVHDAVAAGDEVVVDALRGRVALCPPQVVREQAEARRRRYLGFQASLRERQRPDAALGDGTPISVCGNVEFADEVALAREQGAAGVGLFRTEFLFLDRDQPPSEAEQEALYRRALRGARGQQVVFRSFDLGGDKLPRSMALAPSTLLPRGSSLGARGLRAALQHPELFRGQLRALLRASTAGTAALMFPMVAGLSEFREAVAFVEACKAELAAEGSDFGELPLGVMVEVPAAAMAADLLGREAAFLSVGTNDLLQFSLAADRSDAERACPERHLDAGFLRLLRHAAQGAQRAPVPLRMCGEMAADLLALPIVIGLGFRRLSVPPTAVPMVQEALRSLQPAACEEAAEVVLLGEDAQSNARYVWRRFSQQLGELWRSVGIDEPK